MKLSYLSSRTAGYKSVLRVTLTHSTIPFNLMKVHLMVAVEGRLFRKWFPAAPNLLYDFVWDKTDVYSQKVYGLSEAFGTRSSVSGARVAFYLPCMEHISLINSGGVSLSLSLARLSSVCGLRVRVVS